MSVTSIVSLISLTIGLAVGWFGQGWRMGEQIQTVRLGQATEHIQQSETKIKDLIHKSDGLTYAYTQLHQAQQQQHAALQGMHSTLLDLRTTTTRLRSDNERLPERITAASREQLAHHAAGCGAVFSAMASLGERMAAAGGDFTAAADRHAADAAALTAHPSKGD